MHDDEAMQQIWPFRSAHHLDDADLEQIYLVSGDLSRPWVQANMVTSIDGAIEVDGRSRPLSSPADQRVFALGRDLADVILVGRGTAIAENYRGVHPDEVNAERRRRLGLSPLPAIAVVSARCKIAPDSPLVTQTEVQPIVVTTTTAPEQRVAALRRAGADVIMAGDHCLDLHATLAELAHRGLLRIDCEGGQQLLDAMLDADLVDQLCLTIAPVLAGSNPSTATRAPRHLTLTSVLHEAGHLMLQYRRRGGEVQADHPRPAV